MHLALTNLPATQALARAIAAKCGAGDAITLRGTLGTGKTTFARAFIHALAPDAGEVTSPTFSLMQLYALPEGEGRELWHLDLYRLKNAEEAFELGIEDGFASAIMLIEWPEVIEHLLPADRLDITLDYGDAEEERKVALAAHGKWRERTASLAI